jgi:hypothetical protein
MLTRRLLSLLLLAPLAGCQVYRHTVVPLDIDFSSETVQQRRAKDDIKRITYQSIDVEWGTNAVAEIARRDGMTTVHYVDYEVLSIFGAWTQTWIHVYGQ